MKRAVILHGTDGKPDSNWFMWLKSVLEKHGYEVWVPLLPGNHTPNRKVYNDFLFGSDWDFTDNLIVGHSSGAVALLNLLMDERCPRIKGGALVGVWESMEGTPLDPEIFKDLFPPDGFNFELIEKKAGKLVFLHGDNDPYCPLNQAINLAKRLDSELIVVPGGHHLGDILGGQFPLLAETLEHSHLL